MIVEINTQTLWDNKLTASQYIFLMGIKNNEFDILIDEKELKHLIDEGYILKSSNVWVLKAKGLDILVSSTLSDLDEFIETYRNIFPKGIKSGNDTPVRGDKQGCLKKMTWFLKTYPEFSKHTILEATTTYIKQLQRKGYAYITQADYFIQKDGASKLAAMCEEWNIKNSYDSEEQRL